jgi:hypothetical protein
MHESMMLGYGENRLGKRTGEVAKLYVEMADGELEKIAVGANGLTEIALEILRAEMTRRGLEPPAVRAPWEPRARDGAEDALLNAAADAKIVVVQRFRDLPNAVVAQSILESAGMEVFLSDDNMIRMDWMLSNLLGGIKLLVRAEDLVAATELLAQSIPERFDVDGVGEYEQPRCPECGSFDIHLDELDRKTTYPGLFFRLALPATTRGWNCHACKHAWEEAKPNDGSESGPS